MKRHDDDEKTRRAVGVLPHDFQAQPNTMIIEPTDATRDGPHHLVRPGAEFPA
jgi:hypothetical protein